MRANTRIWWFLALGIGVIACSDGESVNAVPDKNIDPNAPEGWTLAIGDRDYVPAGLGLRGGAEEGFEYWEGNCCINWVNGVPYTAKWRLEVVDGQIWSFYEGHVPAEPVRPNRGSMELDPNFHKMKR